MNNRYKLTYTVVVAVITVIIFSDRFLCVRAPQTTILSQLMHDCPILEKFDVKTLDKSIDELLSKHKNVNAIWLNQLYKHINCACQSNVKFNANSKLCNFPKQYKLLQDICRLCQDENCGYLNIFTLWAKIEHCHENTDSSPSIMSRRSSERAPDGQKPASSTLQTSSSVHVTVSSSSSNSDSSIISTSIHPQLLASSSSHTYVPQSSLSSNSIMTVSGTDHKITKTTVIVTSSRGVKSPSTGKSSGISTSKTTTSKKTTITTTTSKTTTSKSTSTTTTTKAREPVTTTTLNGPPRENQELTQDGGSSMRAIIFIFFVVILSGMGYMTYLNRKKISRYIRECRGSKSHRGKEYRKVTSAEDTVPSLKDVQPSREFIY